MTCCFNRVKYFKRGGSYSRSELNVEATSSDGGSVTLTVAGYGVMTHDSNKNIFKYKVRPVADPGATVTVTTSGGGHATRNVAHKQLDND